MKTQDTPTFMGWNEKLGAWAFSPSMIAGVDKVWDVSDWSWENIQFFMAEVPDSIKHDWLMVHKVTAVVS